MPSVSGDTDADREAIAQLLDEHPEITAFVAAEYQFAVLVHEVLASLGRLDGRTIACFDMPDLPFAPHDFLHVRQDERAMGRLAVDLLVAQVEGDAVLPVSIIPYVIVAPTTDPVISRAWMASLLTLASRRRDRAFSVRPRDSRVERAGQRGRGSPGRGSVA